MKRVAILVGAVAAANGCAERAGGSFAPPDTNESLRDPESVLAVTDEAVVALHPKSGPTVLHQSGAPLRAELSGDGAYFGTYEEGRFVVHHHDGTVAGGLTVEASGLKHRLLERGRVLVPIVARASGHDRRVVAYEIRRAGGPVEARLDVPGARFVRPGADYLVVAHEAGLTRYSLDGRPGWTAGLQALDLAVARDADYSVAVTEDDSRTIVHLRGGKRIGTASFRDPIWNLSLSPSGRFSAATTRTRLHLFEHGSLQRSIHLQAKYATSLDVDDSGRVLAGAQDEEHGGHVFCYSRQGELLREQLVGRDERAFRPSVRWVSDDRYVASGASGHIESCSETGAR